MSHQISELRPSLRDVESARPAAEQLRLILKSKKFKNSNSVPFTVSGGTDEIAVPTSALELLLDLLTVMANGDAITMLPTESEVTTQQAADILNVSRPHVVKLLEDGEIEYRTVGAHRRVFTRSLIEYRDGDNKHRREIADELTSLAQEMDLT
jgi:excisionase family DNA binding protein